MREFRITLNHRPGELARLADLIRDRDLNLKSVAAIAVDHKAILCLVSTDVVGLRTALQEARIVFEESELLTHLVEDRPGQLAALCDTLVAADVNLRSLYILARADPLVEVGFTADDPKKAKKALGL